MGKRVLDEGRYIKDNNKTIREAADIFSVSKSTVHKDLKERLPLIDYDLSLEVNKVLMSNLLNRHIKGGEKTREKYLRMK